MTEPSSPSPGEWVAIMTASGGLLALLGKGWMALMAWRERRRVTRAEGLQQWEDKLRAREEKIDREQTDYQAKIERRLEDLDERYTALHRAHTALHRAHSALRLAFELVAAALRQQDPESRALRQAEKLAEKLLDSAFPLDPTVPLEMSRQLGAIDRIIPPS